MKAAVSALGFFAATILLMLSFGERSRAQECSSTSFGQPLRILDTEDFIGALVASDFNRDGKIDLAVLQTPGVYLYLGNGDGSFRAPMIVFTNYLSNFVVTLATDDYNGDGIPDLVGKGGTNLMLLGNGDGTFAARPIGMDVDVADDFNRDGKLDLAGSLETILGVSLNTGDGTFGAPMIYDVGSGGCCIALLAANVHGAGAPDLVRLDYDGFKSYVSILFNNGDGTFRVGPSQDVGQGGDYKLASGDFNGDGKADLVAIGGIYTNSAAVLLGTGDGTFQSAQEFLAGTRPVAVTVVDLNVDGRPDLAIVGSDTISALFGNGDGTFQTPVRFGTSGPSTSYWNKMSIGDFNGDGRPDLAVVDSSGCLFGIDVFLNRCGDFLPAKDGLRIFRGSASARVSWPFPSTGFSIESSPSLNLPNWRSAVEVATTNNGQWQIEVGLNERERFFRLRELPPPLIPPVHPPVTLTTNDFASLQAAIHGVVTLSFDGIVEFTNTLAIAADTTLDATGHTVSFDGRTMVRHFAVAEGVTLRLINLTLINGRFAGSDGQPNQAGNPGWGGAIYNSGGTVELIDCKFINDQALGGNGGPPNLPCIWVSPGPSTGASAYGGAIYSINGQVSATNCLFANNRCTGGNGVRDNDGYTGGGGDSFGGAIYSTNGGLALVRVTFSNNLAKAGEMSGVRPLFGGGRAYGGAVADAVATTALTNCVFVSNHAVGATKVAFGGDNQSGNANGGALFHGSGTTIIEGSLFDQNTATGGDGSNNGQLTISGQGNGGAIYNQSGNLALRNSALIANQANGGPATGDPPWGAVAGIGAGGAIYNSGALAVINCTLAENSATGGVGFAGIQSGGRGGSAYGGAIFNTGGSASLVNVTIAGNSVQRGDLGVAEALGSSLSITNGTVTLTNTILSCLPSQTNVSGTITDGGHNICSDASANFTLASSQKSTDPLLGPLSDNDIEWKNDHPVTGDAQ